MHLTHEEQAKLIDQYRVAAEKQCNSIIWTLGTDNVKISVNNYGSVQISNDGAFVECLIWISKDEL